MAIPIPGDMASDLLPVTERQNALLIHQLFEKQVERTPEAIAVICGEQSISYDELNRRANHLAHYLQKLGVGPEVLVGLCVDRSVELIIGLLGIFKSGGTYVPIDPEYPPARLAFILEDTQIPVLVTQTHLFEHLSAHDLHPVIVDIHHATITQQDDSNPVSNLKPEHLAYIIYTSGSTGQPKGVLIEHQAIAAHCQTITRLYKLRAEDTILQFSAFTFDASLEQILSALIVGARLIVRGQEIWSPAELLRKIIEFKLTVMDLSPAYLSLALEEWAQISEQLLGHQLRLVIVGGDRLLPEILDLWPRVPFQSVRLLNAYGPTETTITATLLEVATGSGQILQKISIGRPLLNRTAHILDTTGNPVAAGAVGELYIGGDLLARGYLHRPELTAERFLADPFSQLPGARLYKTGDRARYLPDGSIEFLGRVDHQVKIRGFRIELGEIEAVISQHPAVRQVVVTTREDASADLTLAAYIVFHKEKSSSIGELQQLVLSRLPDYMVPSTFVLLESLPLTTSGKVDRQALPAPESRRSAATSFATPTLPLHYQLVQIWEELFNIRPIGIKDDFFELGGHSLLAARLIDRIEQIWNKRLPVSIFHAGTTIEYLAGILTEGTKSAPGQQKPVISMHTGGSRRPFFYLHGQVNASSTLHCYPFAQALGPDQPFYGIPSYPLLDELPHLPTLEEMAAAQIRTIRAIQPEGPYLLGGFCNGGVIAYEIARQLEASGQTVALLLLIDPSFLMYPVALRTYQAAFIQISKLFRLSEAQQLNWALRLKHMARKLSFALLHRKDPDPLDFNNLSQNYFRIYDWIAVKYRPDSLYDGKITFIWAKDGQDAKEYRKGWQIIEAKGDTEAHLVPGNHATCRTDYLPDLTRCLANCVRAAQEATSSQR